MTVVFQERIYREVIDEVVQKMSAELLDAGVDLDVFRKVCFLSVSML